MSETTIINKVADSGLIEFNLEDYYPKEETVVFDMKEYLFMELILKEKDFREALKKKDFAIYQDKLVAVTCSADAIIPMWAYMLVARYLQPVAKDIVVGDEKNLHQTVFLKRLNNIDISKYQEKRVVIKGCGDLDTGPFAYLEITKLLLPVAKSIMYGEPCSTVPIFKKTNTETGS
jgi:LPS O-antigen subunit length determinant protein (WzzB/FepE family)